MVVIIIQRIHEMPVNRGAEIHAFFIYVSHIGINWRCR